jgi:hypothetical protein
MAIVPHLQTIQSTYTEENRYLYVVVPVLYPDEDSLAVETLVITCLHLSSYLECAALFYFQVFYSASQHLS